MKYIKTFESFSYLPEEQINEGKYVELQSNKRKGASKYKRLFQ